MKFVVTVDSKGRISLPSAIRKTLAINESDRLDMLLLTSQNKILLVKNGCDGVIGNTTDCGSVIPGSNPGRGPRGDKK